MGTLFLVVPVLSSWLGRPLTTGALSPCVLASVPVFLIAVYVATYSVMLTTDRILIRVYGFRAHAIPMTEIVRVSVASTRNGAHLVVLLKSGKIIRFAGVLSGFALLQETLAVLELQQSDEQP